MLAPCKRVHAATQGPSSTGNGAQESAPAIRLELSEIVETDPGLTNSKCFLRFTLRTQIAQKAITDSVPMNRPQYFFGLPELPSNFHSPHWQPHGIHRGEPSNRSRKIHSFENIFPAVTLNGEQ